MDALVSIPNDSVVNAIVCLKNDIIVPPVKIMVMSNQYGLSSAPEDQ